MGPILLNDQVDPRSILMPNGQPARYTPPPAPIRTPAPVASNPIRPSLFSRIGTIARQDVFNPIGSQISRDVQPIKALGADVTGLVRAGAGAITHNPIAEQNALNEAQNRTNIDLAPGKSFITSKEVAQGGTSLIKPIAKGVAENVPYVIGPEGSALAKTVPGKMLAGGISQGLANFLSSVAQQKLDTGKVNVGEAAKSAIPAAVAGAIIPGIKPGVDKLATASEKLNATPLGKKLNNIPVGLSTKDVSETPKPKVAQSKVAPVTEIPKSFPKGVRAGTARINQTIGTELKPSQYIKRAQSNLKATSEQNLKKLGLDAFTGKVDKALSQTSGRLTDQQLSDAYLAADQHMAAGNTKLANEIYSKTLPHDTKTAQALAARAMLTKYSPQGIQNMVNKALKNVNVKPEAQARIDSLLQDLRKTADNTPERELAIRKLSNEVTQNIPRPHNAKSFLEFWRAMLISGPQTAVKVAISQPISGGQSFSSQFPAAALDAFRSAVRGTPRTTSATFKGFGGGLKEGFKSAGIKIKTGVDVPGSGGFVHPIDTALKLGHHQTLPERTIFNLHSAIQKPIYSAIRQNTLARLGKAQAINQGLKGTERDAFINDYIKNPPQDAYAHALSEGEEAVNQQKTGLGSAANRVQGLGHGAGMVIAPITRSPGAIATNALYNYSGAKLFVDTVYKGIIQHGVEPNLARTIAEDFGKAAVGAGSVSGLGAILGATGNLTPAKAESTKQAALYKAQGAQLGSVRIPGTHFWISLNALGPVGIELAGGGGAGRGFEQGGVARKTIGLPGALLEGAASAGQELAKQPYVQGIADVGNVLNEPVRNVRSYIASLGSSVVPALLSQTAAGVNKNTPEINYNSFKDQLQSKIPGLRGKLPTSYDTFGQPNLGANPSGSIFGGVLGTLDALKPSLIKGQNNAGLTEAARLVLVIPAGDNNSPSISKPSRTISVTDANGKTQKLNLNDQQFSSYIKTSGDLINQGVNRLIKTADYQKLNDEQRGAEINKIIEASHTAAKVALLGDNPKTLSSQAKTAITNPNELGKFISSIKTTSPLAKAYTAGKSFLTTQKSAGNYTGWLSTAQNQLKLISQQLSANPSNASSLSNEALTLTNDMAKYQAYGGFTKPTGTPTFKALSISGAQPQYVSAITQSAAKYGVDIRAALAVAAMEGLGGGVGDNGTSYGPFQLHVGGELPAGQTQAWAESPAGIDYAVQKISQVAKGLTGQAAIQAIVNSFEQPANPTAEINGALAIYNGGKATVGGSGGASISSSGSGSSAKYPTGIPKNTQFTPITRSEKAFTNVIKGTQKPYSTKIPTSLKASLKGYSSSKFKKPSFGKSEKVPKLPKALHGRVSSKKVTLTV